MEAREKEKRKKNAVGGDKTRSENASFISQAEKSVKKTHQCMKSPHIQRFFYCLLLIYSLLIYLNAAFYIDYSYHLFILQSLELFILLLFLTEFWLITRLQGYSYLTKLTTIGDVSTVLICLAMTVGILSGSEESWPIYLKFVILLRYFRVFEEYRKENDWKYIAKVKPASIEVMTVGSKVVEILSSLREAYPALEPKLKWCIELISSDRLHSLNLVSERCLQTGQVMPWIQSFSNEQARRHSKELLEIPLFPDVPLGTEGILMAPEAVHTCLERVNKFDFDVFEMKKACDGNELLTLVTFLFTKSNLLGFFPGTQVREWTLRVQQGYIAANTYHNATHAADVVQTIHSFLFEYKAVETLSLHLLDVACCYLSAAMHDYQHPGRNNKFLIATRHPLAILYNDSSVLENHHVAAGFALAEKEGMQIFSRLKKKEFEYLRGRIVGMVLATDMSRHFIDLSAFQSYICVHSPSDPYDKVLCMDLLLHCSDISNPAKPWPLCRRWAELVSGEFFAQGDEERMAGLAISDLCDRDKTVLEKAQMGFIGVIVQPMFASVNRVLVGMGGLLQGLQDNKERWKGLLDSRGG